ncbi:MAG: acyl-CoA dehydrogenase family protein [Cyanobacteria bacterium P01_A01_bin.3]
MLQDTIAPQATALDSEPDALRDAFYQLGQAGLLGLKVPQEWGGREWTPINIDHYTEQVARYSGALAFLQTQHQSAAGALAKSDNQELKELYLRSATRGDIGLGVGFSHLRRSHQPPVTATALAEGSPVNGYRVSGTVPWITGYSTFQHFILGAQLQDGSALFALIPFRSSDNPDGGLLHISDPMQLAAMQSTQTVAATFTDYTIPSRLIIDIKPPNWIHTRDRLNPLSHSFFALGCARAGLDVLESAQNPQIPAISNAFQTLNRQLEDCRSATYSARSGDTPQPLGPDRLELRAEAIDLAVRCAHAAVTASRGSANYRQHPAQRIYREALAFTVFGQTTNLMTATLDRIANGLNA